MCPTRSMRTSSRDIIQFWRQDLLSEDLSLFRIADDQLEPQFLFAFEEQSFSSDLRYCDRAIMMSQLDALITYLHSLVEPPPFQKGKVGF